MTRTLAFSIAAAAVGSAAHAIDFTYAEAGAFWELADESTSIPGAQASVDSGVGARIAGGIDVALGFYVDGEVSWTELDAEASATQAARARSDRPTRSSTPGGFPAATSSSSPMRSRCTASSAMSSAASMSTI